MIDVGIIGASGYTGAELARILSNHPEVRISVATSRQYAGKKLTEVYPHLAGKTDIICENNSIGELVDRADVFFTAVPHRTAMEIIPSLLTGSKKIVDLSADFRIKDPAVYEEWYQPHTSPEYIEKAVYGLPELYREQITSTRLVANPGCYPTSIILGLTPLLENGAIEPQSIIIDSKSGTSGAGRAASVSTLYCEVADGFRPYKIAEHRHTPEIEQELSILSNTNMKVSFTPHLLPISRGILSTIYATLKGTITAEMIHEMYHDRYGSEPFVRMVNQPSIPATQFVRGSNFCDIGFKIDPRTNRIVVISTIDNIVKGASGQAVQNMNLMFGFEETAGLEGSPFFP